MAGAASAHPSADTFIGFRNDGTGVFPPDCDPVTEWNEWDFRDVGDGRKARSIPVKPNPKNIVWKVPLDNYCNGGMILAGGRLLQMVDRGGNGYATDLVPQFVGPVLVCMDPKDGRVLWKRELHHFGNLPAARAAQAREDVLDYYAWWASVFGPYFRWHEKAGMRWNPIRTPEQEQAYAEAAEAFATVWEREAVAAGTFKAMPPVPVTAKALNECPEWTRIARTYTQCAFWKLEKSMFPKRYEQRRRVIKLGYPFGRFFGEGSWIGEAMPTPVSDGKRVWVNTGYNDVFCLDLDGEVLWSKYFGPTSDLAEGPVTSSILVDGLLVTHTSRSAEYRALWVAAGEVAWTYRGAKPGPGGGAGTPLHLLLPVGKDGEKLSVIWTHNGDVVRLRDGAVLAESVGHHGNYRTAAAWGDVVILSNGSAEGGHGSARTYPRGTVAVRLKAESPDKVTATQVWHRPDLARASLVAYEGIVYFDAKRQLCAVDVASGKDVASIENPPLLPNHVWSIAGGRLFGLNSDGRCLVASLGKGMKVLATNRLGGRPYCTKGSCYVDFFNEGAQPLFSGNRIFVRSYTHVYCIGDASEPMRLSAIHR